MRITRLELPSTDVEACLAFYRDVLQLKTMGNTVQAGWTALDIVPATLVAHGAVHLAFNVPHHRFAAACEWMAARALLLRSPLGEERFHLGEPWHSDSVYFAGPHDAVLELIAREPLASEGRGWGPFHGSEIACVSEIGLPTDDVPAVVRELVVRFGIAPFGEGSETFVAMGGHEGLLIVVDRARTWFPAFRQAPSASGVRVWLDGVSAAPRLRHAAQWELVSALQERRQRGGDQAVVVG